MAFVGSIAGIAAPALKIWNAWGLTPVPLPLANGIPIPGMLLLIAAIGGFVVALHHEKEPFSVFVAASGIPALVFAVMSIPGISL